MNATGFARIVPSALLAAAFLSSPGVAAASQAPVQERPGEALTRPRAQAVVASLCDRIRALYAAVESTEKVCAALAGNAAAGRYDGLSPRDFAARVDGELEAQTGDKHFGLSYDPAQAAAMADDPGGGFYTPAMVEGYRRMNFGVLQVRILEGNVGYLDLRDFFSLRWSAGALTGATSFLAESDAVIVDLRFNGGGEDSTVNFLLSYFFDPKTPLTFASTWSKASDTYYTAGTWPWVPGRTLSDKPLYVLTSKSSFSGAEAFAYRIKALGRGVLVGETTRGGQSPVEIVPIERTYVAYIPSEKFIGSKRESWEGTGVRPDIETDAEAALETAHVEALKRLADATKDDARRASCLWTIEGVRAAAHPASVAPDAVAGFAGRYAEWEVAFEGGTLRARRGGRAALRLVPMGEDRFLVETMDRIRFRFVRGEAGAPVLEILRDDGTSRRIPREAPADAKRNGRG